MDVPMDDGTLFRPFDHAEHALFLEALQKHAGGTGKLTGREWQKMAQHVQSRTDEEVKIHAYRYFATLQAVSPREVVTQMPGGAPQADERKGDADPWSQEEDLILENAVALVAEGDPQRWSKIASMLPSKSPQEVEARYQRLLVSIMRIEMGEAGGKAR
eukprot:FR741923.1.p1 GENE.FR741923.1~~FR741923.1.p1  ORF type:complete len:159 (+),score=15.28 FR741923.1:100-576(+)